MGILSGCQLNRKGCSKKTDQKLDTYDWLCDIPESMNATDLVEVTFKNTRKGYFRNTNGLALEKGDVVAVEATPGHDIGTVSMTGQLVLAQMKKYHVDQSRTEIKRIYRKARPNDLEKFEEAKAKEHDTMLRARKIAENLNLNMKIGDVEYQGDGNKAIFYYIADERVDFRELIKVLADTFRVRIEMKQIGARQEAGRIGGIGPCGRPLCCSSWLTKFSSVATSSARYQEISLNPQKLAGQCAKLKCCLNYEVDAYVEAQKEIPARNIPLETKDGTFYHFKTDVFGKIMQYSSAPNMASNVVSIPVDRVKEIMALNKQGIKVDSLLVETEDEGKPVDYENVVGQDSLTRFDKKKKKKKKGGKGNAASASAESQQTAAPSNTQDQNPENDGKPDHLADGTNEQRPAAKNNEARKTESPASPNENGDPAQKNSNGGQRNDRKQNRDRNNKNNRKPQQGKPNNQQPQPAGDENAPVTAENGTGDQPQQNQNGNQNRNRNNRRRNNNFRRNNGGNGENPGGNNNGKGGENASPSNNSNPQGGNE